LVWNGVVGLLAGDFVKCLRVEDECKGALMPGGHHFVEYWTLRVFSDDRL